MDSKIADPGVAAIDGRAASAAKRIGPLGTLRANAPIAESRGLSASMLRDSIFRRTLVVADTVAILSAFLVTIALSSKSLQLTWASIAGLPILLIGAKIFGLYDRDDALLRKTTLEEAPKLFQVATLCALVSWLTGGLIVEGTLDRHQAVFLWLLLAALLILTRTIARAFALRIAPAERCLFIGDSDGAKTIRSKLSGNGGIKASLVAHLDLDKIAPWSTDTHSAERLAEVRALAQHLDIQRAIIAPRSADAGEMLDLVRTLKAVGVRVSILPRLLEVVGSSVVFDDLHGVTVMGVRRFELTRSSAAVKRTFDLLYTTVGLLAVAPLMLVAAVAIKLDSPGPVFFRQERVGRHGKRFRIFKFRTMVQDAESLKESLRARNEAEGGLFKIAEDPRITRVGRLLRKTALDELPQMLNILKGEMSLVGPRPLVVDEDMRVQGWHRRRLELTPGMTGPGQIPGPSRVPLREMVASHYLYVGNWSLWNDIKIMLRTISYVVSFRGV